MSNFVKIVRDGYHSSISFFRLKNADKNNGLDKWLLSLSIYNNKISRVDKNIISGYFHFELDEFEVVLRVWKYGIGISINETDYDDLLANFPLDDDKYNTKQED